MIHIVAEGSSDMAAKKRDYSLNASLYSRPRKTAAEIADLKKRANKRKMLEAQMKGLREEGKHWDKYIGRTERKRKATKAIKTAAEIAELAAGVPAIGKAIGKKVVKKGLEKASKKAVKITPDSKFAQRTAKSQARDIVKKTTNRPGVLAEKTTVKGGKATTPKLPKGAGGSKPRRSLPRSPNKPAGDAGKRVAKREQYYKEREALKKAAEKNKKLEEFLKGSGAPKTSAKNIQKVKEAKKAFDKGFSKSAKAALRKGVKKAAPKKASSTKRPKRGPALKVDKGSKFDKRTRLSKKKATAKAPAKKPATERKPKGTWNDPDLGQMVREINRKRSLPTRLEPWEKTGGKGKKLSPEELKKWEKIARKIPVPKRKKPGSGGKGRK